MNTAKIAALYASPIFNTLLRWPNYDPTTTVTQALQQEAMLEQNPRYRNGIYHAAAPGEISTTYRVDIHDFKDEKRYDEFGARMYALIDGAYPERVHRWAGQQLPTEDNIVAQGQRWVASTHRYVRDASREIINSTHLDRWGSEADFATLVRGLRAYRRKNEKYLKKTEAQLRAYHQQQVLAAQAKERLDLRRGHWLGVEKAITTAARTNEPGIPFLGDAGLSDEQRQALGLRYWTVPEEAGMSAALPAGTGIALQVITSHKQLVDGAIYLSQLSFGEPTDAHYHPVMRLGRLDKSRKQYGAIPIFGDDAPEKDLHVQAEWKPKQPGQGYEVLLMQVVYYTTRAAQAPAMQAETQPARVQPRKRRLRRELAYAA